MQTIKKFKTYIRSIRKSIQSHMDFRYSKIYDQIIDNALNKYAETYVDFSRNSKRGDYKIKPIAFYLPQFHPIKENNEWWGEGFTEWTNVSRAVPQFLGHQQPRYPRDLGFYDLRLKEVQQRQIEIAKNYGIYGFCYYYYWFNGKRLLEMPVERHLADRDIDFNYCLCWANENWTRQWDGRDKEVLMRQEYSPEDDLSFIKSLVPHFADPRYIRHLGRPLLLVYRPSLLPDARQTAVRWRAYCRDAGIGEIYLANVHSCEEIDPREIGFDAAVQFPPGMAPLKTINKTVPYVNAMHTGKIYDYRDVKDHFLNASGRDYKLFRGITPGWDNTPRRMTDGKIFVNSTPDIYEKWFEKTCDLMLESDHQDAFVFINAWNEWAEGAVLEPDHVWGYAFLEKTYNVVARKGE